MPTRRTSSALRRLTRAAPQTWVSLRLLTAAESNTYSDILESLSDRAEQCTLATLEALVTEASADSNVLGAHADEEQLHLRRNLLAALCVTAEIRCDVHGSRLLAAVPRLPRRTHLLRGRPLFDDERLLMRLIVTNCVRRGPTNYIAAAKYTLTEIGATPGEATAVYIDNLDDPRQPSHVWIPGNRIRERRELALDDWQSEVLGLVATNQAKLGDLERPLAYHGEKEPGGPKANMSCHRSLDNLLDRAGLWHQEDITASSITYSAAARILRKHGRDAAISTLGRNNTPEAVREARAARDLRALGTEPAPTGEIRVRSFLTDPFPPYQPPEKPITKRRKAN